MAAAAPAMALNGIKTGTASQGHLERTAAKETEVLISGFCRHFYNRRWVIGTAGSIAVKVHNVYIRKSQQLMVMSPSGGLSASSSKPCLRKTTKSSGCDSLFMKRALDLSCPSDGPIQRVRSSLGIGMEQNVSTKARKSEEVLFPYARANVGRHLSTTYDTPETQDDIKLLRSQVQNDLEQGIAGAVPIPSDDARKEEVIAALVANVEAMIKADRKITALKELQGHIWQTGFEGKELEAIVFDDVPKALEKWHALGKKVYIYSSGSRLAQRLIFGNTNYGDLRKYLCGFFDTKVGNKRETSSYVEIFESLGVDKPSNILFLTDVSQEATAAKSAGLEVVISVRPGNGPLPENHGFRTVNSFLEV
ncbi:probable bifunctional methylthioribulose-1-phosphate dehydratase/enolase-phosphatase E1 isoform X2 [Prosopis cineraria]|uniref:probable bifunctional methylthioribulose-1-phosphate dehydratase/enolase-phosphatase E1 isoform X2 n=1 Tax=Prosopis cineraria TaxID=364024 RepID=UPI00240FC704|nr:probable bifunctional methylthioribulose-1-phosphate dehydratase/enolase-phosphatase E1 isoform X2 [Prosopis cineraria]